VFASSVYALPSCLSVLRYAESKAHRVDVMRLSFLEVLGAERSIAVSTNTDGRSISARRFDAPNYRARTMRAGTHESMRPLFERYSDRSTEGEEDRRV
jgi:hypothetical protein